MHTEIVYVIFRWRCEKCQNINEGYALPSIFKKGQIVQCPHCAEKTKVEAGK